MTAAGLVNFGTYCKDPCFVKLSQTIVSYTRTLIPHCNAVLKMYSEELYYPIIDSISELLRIIINVLTDAMRNVRDDDKSKCWCFSGSRHFSGNRQHSFEIISRQSGKVFFWNWPFSEICRYPELFSKVENF